MRLPWEPTYAGFWRRTGAMVIDSIAFGLLLAILLYGLKIAQLPIGESELPEAPASSELKDAEAQSSSSGGRIRLLETTLIENALPAAATIAFWVFLGATPGKFLFECRVVDAQTGRPPGWARASIRYLCYFVSFLPLGLGFLWIAWDKRKQGWHDKLAGTLVLVEDLERESMREWEHFVAR